MGIVFNIQHFSIHDGPGIRTVVFLKGCPLRCKWCANPESQLLNPEMGWTKGDCIGCNTCIKEIKELSCRFEEDRLYWDSDALIDDKRIENICPTKAFHIMGKEMSESHVINEVSRDIPFFTTSGGGITLSGGEPLMQPEFAYGILKMAGEKGINRTIETSSFASYDVYRKVMSQVDYLITDIKVMNHELHKKWTGVSNKLILDNIRKIREELPNLIIHIRTPIIPGVNDSLDKVEEIVDYCIKHNLNYELLRYHRFGVPKYESLNRTYPMNDVELSDDIFNMLESFAIKKYSDSKCKGIYGPPSLISGFNNYEFTDGAGI